MTDCDTNPFKFREIILNTRKPLVFRNFPLNSSCFQDGLEGWCKKFDESNCSPINFERISRTNCFEPQWERKRELIPLKAMQFLEEHGKDCEYWSGLNYKRRFELPVNCTNGIDFSPFGFPQAADDSTLWLCSNGANTPCHYDSYGCNIVVQVFGKKSWHLFAPDTPLTTTRIPYEESSVYCKENFYSPTNDMMKNIEAYKGLAYNIILEPNDVLIVPKHWWHYVEAINISLSVNTWIPLKCDVQQKIEECIVKYLIENFFKNSPSAIKVYVINPNQLTNFSTNAELFEILKFLIEKTMKKNSNAKMMSSPYDYHYLSDNVVEQLLSDFKGLRQISSMTFKELECFLKPRYTSHAGNSSEESALSSLEEILVNSICSPHVVKTIRSELLRRFK